MFAGSISRSRPGASDGISALWLPLVLDKAAKADLSAPAGVPDGALSGDAVNSRSIAGLCGRPDKEQRVQMKNHEVREVPEVPEQRDEKAECRLPWNVCLTRKTSRNVEVPVHGHL